MEFDGIEMTELGSSRLSSVHFGTLADKLRLAASKGQLEHVQQLIEDGAGFQRDKEGRSALHYAALNGYIEVCKYLVGHGCSLDDQDVDGYTPLHRAASQGHTEVMRILLEEGCSINTQDEHGNTALHEAAWNGFSAALELLIKHNCNVNVVNKTGFTALHLSSQNGHNQSSRVLLYGGCNSDLQNNYGDTALHTAARYGHAGVTRILISARCALNAQNKNGDTALHIAAALKRRKIAKLLVEAGIDVYVKNKQSENAIDVARRKDHGEVIVIITSFQRPKTPKMHSQHGIARPKSVIFKEPHDLPDGPMVVPDDTVPVKSENKPSKESKKFFFFKKKKKEKEKPSENKQAQIPGSKPVKPPIKGFFSQYEARPGTQYYRDLAGNIKQGPIGYTATCQCVPSLNQLRTQLENNTENLYDHIDASNHVLQQRLCDLDKRTAHQVYSIDKLTRERLAQEEKNCHGRIKQQLEQEREMILQRYREQAKSDINNWLEAKLMAYGHCLDHHHDDSALPNNNLFMEVHQMEGGRLFKSRSDETLSQSDYSGKFRKKEFYQSRQAAMNQIRGWQLPQPNNVQNCSKNDTKPSQQNLGQGDVYSQKHVKIGQIEMYPGPPRENVSNPKQKPGNVYFDMMSPSTASTTRTPNVQRHLDPVYGSQRYSNQQGAIPKRVPQSQSWHNARHPPHDSIYHEPNQPLHQSTPAKVHNMHSVYESLDTVRPLSRSQTDPDGASFNMGNPYRQTQSSRVPPTQQVTFPERGSSNIKNTGNDPVPISSRAGKDPQPSSCSSGGGLTTDQSNRPTFTTFGYYESEAGKAVVTSETVQNVDQCPPRPGSSLMRNSTDDSKKANDVNSDPYGSHVVSSHVSKFSEKKDVTQEQPLENGHGFNVPHDDNYMHLPPPGRSSLRYRSKSSEGILLDEEELLSAHDMKVKLKVRPNTPSRSQTPNTLKSSLRAGTPNGLGSRSQTPREGQFAESDPRVPSQAAPFFNGNRKDQNSVYIQNQRQTPVNYPPGHYMSMNGHRPNYSAAETQYTSMKELQDHGINGQNYPRAVYGQNPSGMSAYHNVYTMSRFDHPADNHHAENPEIKALSKSESNLLDRSGSSNCENSPRGDYLKTLSNTRDATPDRDIRNMANYPNAYTKEDSSSNPDSGYSSKIFGNRNRPGQAPSNSCSPSFNSGTPSSSFSTDHNISTPGNSHTSSPYTHASHADYEQIPSREKQQYLHNHVQDWYQRKLKEAANKFRDGTYADFTRMRPNSTTEGLRNQFESSGSQNPPQYHGNGVYSSFQEMTNGVHGSDV